MRNQPYFLDYCMAPIKNRFILEEKSISHDTIEITLKLSPNIKEIGRIPYIEVPFDSLKAIVKVYEQGNKGKLDPDLFRRRGTLVSQFQFPVQDLISPIVAKITRLTPSSLHKFDLSVEHPEEGRLASQTVFISTNDAPEPPKPVPEPEIGLSKTEAAVLKNTEGNFKPEILEGRKTKDWKDYMKCGYKHPGAFSDIIGYTRLKRSLVIGETFEVLDELDEEKKTEIVNGGWFMGPIYTHDPHYEKMLKDSQNIL